MKKTYCYRASIFFSTLIYDHVKMCVKVTDSFKIIGLSAYLFQTKDSTPYFFDFYFLPFPLSCSLPCNIPLAVCLLVILSSLPFPSLPFPSLLIFSPAVKSLLGSLDTSRKQEKITKAAADEAAKRGLAADSTMEQRERDWTARYHELSDW